MIRKYLISDEPFWRELPPDFKFREVLKVYNYQDISKAAAKATIINFLCSEVKRGTFQAPNQPQSDLNALSEEEMENIVKNTKTFGGVFQGYLKEGGKIYRIITE